MIIQSINSLASAKCLASLSVLHAISGRFDLCGLSRYISVNSEHLSNGQSETREIYNAAVPVLDYQQRLLEADPLRSVVPPSSVHLTIVERYIPPASSHEFATIFDRERPSILIDRLMELSPHMGTLVFIYPTRKGAKIFMDEYLGPLLDPTVRSIFTVNDLLPELGKVTSSILSINGLLEHHEMQHEIEFLCSALNARSQSKSDRDDQRGQFELTYASKREVRPPRTVWASEWWTKQERPWVASMMAGLSRRRALDPKCPQVPFIPAELTHQLFDGVCKRPYGVGEKPLQGIEVSVFVITRLR